MSKPKHTMQELGLPTCDWRSYALFRAALESRDSGEREHYYDRALQVDEYNVAARVNLASLHTNAHRHDHAAALLTPEYEERALTPPYRCQPISFTWLYVRALVCFQRSRYAAAQPPLERLLQNAAECLQQSPEHSTDHDRVQPTLRATPGFFAEMIPAAKALLVGSLAEESRNHYDRARSIFDEIHSLHLASPHATYNVACAAATLASCAPSRADVDFLLEQALAHLNDAVRRLPGLGIGAKHDRSLLILGKLRFEEFNALLRGARSADSTSGRA